MRSRASALRAVLAAAVVLVAIAFLRHALTGLDVHATLRAVREVGPWAPLALVPFVVAMALDTTGIRVLLGAMETRDASAERKTGFARLLPIRIATEALHVTAPAGFLVADSATAALLDTRCGVPLGEGAVLAIARKWLVMRAHATYIVLGTLCGSGVLVAMSERVMGNRWLPWSVAASALVPLALSLGVGSQFRGSRSFERLRALIARLPWAAIRERAVRSRRSAAALDATMGRIGAQRAASWQATACFFGAWLFETAETCLLIRLVGGPLDLGLAMAVEVGISLLRSMANVAPAGLGVQDAGYAVVLQAMGLPAPTTAAFVLVKRGKELVWIGVGYTILAWLRRGRSLVHGATAVTAIDAVASEVAALANEVAVPVAPIALADRPSARLVGRVA
ncbi:MAG TPA: lysylphosphatidylglycerol synthase domain-containing protein [Polyangiaceae bacterium]|nr:lysylphosphatidylglycerol synthase domain-containing protein [Polyangiaceae bacterium]